MWAPCGLACKSQNCPKTSYTVYTVKHNAVFCSKRKIISFQVSGMCRKANFQEVQQSQLLPFTFSPLTTLKSTTNRKLWALATLYYNVRRLAPCSRYNNLPLQGINYSTKNWKISLNNSFLCQGSNIVPSRCSGQVDFLARQLTFKAHLAYQTFRTHGRFVPRRFVRKVKMLRSFYPKLRWFLHMQ